MVRDWGGILAPLQQRILFMEGRLAELEASGQRLMATAGKAAEGLSYTQIIERLEKAADAITPLVREALLANYRKAGIGTSPGPMMAGGNSQPHGWLIKLIQATTVQVKTKLAGKEGILVPRFQVTLGGGTATNKQYEIAASINYGAVHTPRDFRKVMDIPSGKFRTAEAAAVGYAAKRTLKKFASAGTISKRALSAIQRGARFHGHQVTKGIPLNKKTDRWSKEPPHNRSVRLNHGVWVSIPFPFFYFDLPQIGKIQAVVEKTLLGE